MVTILNNGFTYGKDVHSMGTVRFKYVGGYMTKWLTIATIMGLGGGLVALVLNFSINSVSTLSKPIPLWLSPAIGGLAVIVIYKFDSIASGFGTDRYIETVNNRGVRFKFRTTWTKILATAITLGFNGSGGVEGPMLVIGSSMTEGILKIKFINEYFTEEERRTLMICGAAGAIGAIFRSPLGGGVFVVEVLYRSSLHYTELFPALLSSTMGFVIYSMVYKSTPFFNLPNYLPNVFNVPLFILSAITAGIVSLIFMYIFKWTQNVFSSQINSKLNPFVGGIITGIILFFIPLVRGTGTSVIQELIVGQMPLSLLLFLIIGKMFATSFTVASGGSAGLVIPALFLGATSGNILAVITNAESGLSSSLVIAGMTASLASIANVPLAAAIMLVEMVGLRIAIPATLGSIIGYAIGHNRVIYGVTNPDHWQYEYMNKWKEDDRKLKDH